MEHKARSVAVGTPPAYLPPFHPDELVYSYVARFKHHRALTMTSTNLQLFGRENGSQLALPTGLEKLASRFRQPAITAHHIAWSHTLLPYLTAFRTPASRERVMAAMVGNRDIAGSVGGISFNALGNPDRLRFCTQCQQDMLDHQGELYWRRAHQLPIAVMCPDHGIPLQLSKILIETTRRLLHHASADNCPADAPTALGGQSGLNDEALRDLSVEANDLLTAGDMLTDRSGIVDDLLEALHEKGYVGSTGHVPWEKMRHTVDQVLGGIAPVFPQIAAMRAGYSVPAWIERLRHRSERPIPSNVLLAKRIVAAAPVLVPVFGPGPWECMNPASDHFGAATITRISRRTTYADGYRALFKCACGYAYTRQSHADGSIGKPRFSCFGPLLGKAVANARTKNKSLWVTAESLGMPVVALLNAMEKEGVPIHWPKLPQAYRDGSAKRKARAFIRDPK